MADILASYTIDQVVMEALLTLPENQRTESEYDRFLNFLVRGLTHLRILVTKDGKKRLKITPNSLNRYDFPDDMEEFLSLYVPVSGGIWRLTKDNSIIPTKTTTGLDDSLDTDYGEGVDMPVAQYNTFTSKGGVNREGYFTINYEDREIVINNNRKTELVLEYISSGIKIGSTTNIPSKYVEALKQWIFWKDIEADRTVPESKKDSYEKRFNRKVRDIKIIEGPSLDELFDAWNSKSMVRG